MFAKLLLYGPGARLCPVPFDLRSTPIRQCSHYPHFTVDLLESQKSSCLLSHTDGERQSWDMELWVYPMPYTLALAPHWANDIS